MILLADGGDMLSFAFTMVFWIALPVAGIVVNLASTEKRGLNPKCALSTVLFFAAFLLIGIVIAMTNKEAILPIPRFYVLASAAGIHGISALLAMLGLGEIRNHRKWGRGRQRGLWGFWTNVLFLTALAVWFYLQLNRPLYHRLFD